MVGMHFYNSRPISPNAKPKIANLERVDHHNNVHVDVHS